MKLRFTPQATDDIANIGYYFLDRNPEAGLRVRAAIYDGLQTLLLFPNAGRLQKLGTVRKFVTQRYSFLIYYLADKAADEIVVLNVKHSAQKRDFEDT